MYRDVRRLLRVFLSRRLWAALATLALVGFFAAGAFSLQEAAHGGHEGFPLNLFFGGNTTEQVFFFGGLVLICAFMVPVCMKFSNVMKLGLWVPLVLGLAMWGYNENGHRHGRPVRVFDVLHHPELTLVLGLGFIVLWYVVGFLFVIGAGPERDTHFGHATKSTWLSRALSGWFGAKNPNQGDQS